MKKMNLGFIMVGLVFLISISVLSCQADEADDYFQGRGLGEGETQLTNYLQKGRNSIISLRNNC